MVVKTKSIFKPKEDNDGLRILITRFYPRGLKKGHFDLWIRELSPSIDLLMAYKNGNYNWNIFKDTFLYEIANNINSLEMVYALHEQSIYDDITLLCFEKDNKPCHRYFVRDIIETPDLLSTFFESEDTNDHE